jgi:REP element-mobilizing transposase RayT
LKSSHFGCVLITDRFDLFGHTHESQIQSQKQRARAPAPHDSHSHMTHASLQGKYEYRRRLPHYQKDDRALFVTFCCGCLDPLPESVRDIVLRHCLHDQGTKAEIHAVVVMPDHVHLLLTPLRDSEGNLYSLVEILQGIKGSSAHSLNRALRRSGPVWQEESFDHVLRTEESFSEKVEYIRQNPVRRGLVTVPEDYRWLWVG